MWPNDYLEVQLMTEEQMCGTRSKPPLNEEMFTPTGAKYPLNAVVSHEGVEESFEGCECLTACDCGTDEEDGFDSEEVLVKGDPFCYHKVTENCSEDISDVRFEFRCLRDLICGTEEFDGALEAGPNRDLCIQYLNLAMMLAIQGLVISDPGSEPVS